MDLKPFQGKQLQVFHTFSNGSPYKDCDGLVVDGSVRSGKSVVTSCLFNDLTLRNSPKHTNVNSMIGSATYTSAMENIVEPYILPFLKMLNIPFKAPSKSGSNLVINDGKYKIEIEIHGTGLANSHTKIQGRTYLNALIDEGTLAHPKFLKMLQTRLSLPESKLLINTNPDKPDHYVKTDIIDNLEGTGEKNFAHYHFELDDNIYLAKSVKDRLKRSFTGIFYDRYIKGLWVAIEGRVFLNFSDDNIKEFENGMKWEYYAGLDFGWNDPAAIVILAYDRKENIWYIIDEIVESNIRTETMAELLVGKEVQGGFGVKRLSIAEHLPQILREVHAGHEAKQSRQESGGLSNKKILCNKYDLFTT